MSRDDGFRHADVDVRIFDDPKVRALVRGSRDEGLVARCMVAHLSVVTASWAAGGRVSLEDAAPAWLTGLDDLAERLSAVGLLDAEGRLPARSWGAWFQPAADRQERARERWRRYNERRPRGNDAVPLSDHHVTATSVTSGPSGPIPLNGRAPSGAREEGVDVV